MVYFYESNVVNPPAQIYMGKDKFENEDLIKYGLEEDVWFHVDNLSSAHVYLRLEPGQDWENIDAAVLQDCAQLCKANSIEGSKRNNITVIYTPWSNLRKTKGMETGQVGFKKEKLVKKVFVEVKENATLNRLNKTKKEVEVDAMLQEQLDRRREMTNQARMEYKNRIRQETEKKRIEREEKEKRSYKHVLKEDQMVTNQDVLQQYSTEDGQVDIEAFEEDFM